MGKHAVNEKGRGIQLPQDEEFRLCRAESGAPRGKQRSYGYGGARFEMVCSKEVVKKNISVLRS